MDFLWKYDAFVQFSDLKGLQKPWSPATILNVLSPKYFNFDVAFINIKTIHMDLGWRPKFTLLKTIKIMENIYPVDLKYKYITYSRRHSVINCKGRRQKQYSFVFKALSQVFLYEICMLLSRFRRYSCTLEIHDTVPH